ncbi:hypothetical protein BDK51DRAFT_30946, partial [Blyttiomyces helicus]
MASEEEAMMAMMGFGGFGKKTQPRNAPPPPDAFDTTRRVVPPSSSSAPNPAQSLPSKHRPDDDDEDEADDGDIGRKPKADGDDEEEEEEEDGDEADVGDVDLDALPVSHQAKLHDHSKLINTPLSPSNRSSLQTVSALSLDPSGARLATGGRDSMVKLWDFNGMGAEMRPFRSFEPCPGNP